MDKTIIVADDSKIMQTIIESALSSDFNILKANDGKEAIDMISTNNNIVGMLLDLNMPEYDGFTTLEYFKENKLFRQIPVSIISGDNTKDTIEKAFTYDIVDMLNKPFSTENIKMAIEKMEAFKIIYIGGSIKISSRVFYY